MGAIVGIISVVHQRKDEIHYMEAGEYKIVFRNYGIVSAFYVYSRGYICGDGR